MNDQRLADTVRRALANIVDEAPAPAPWPLQVVPPASSTSRWVLPAAAVALGVVGAGAVMWTAGHERGGSSQVLTSPGTAAPTTSPAPLFVDGAPTCGSQLPLMVQLGTSSGPFPGPADGVGIEPAVGQYVEHWDFAEGSLEFRWPVDEGEFRDDRAGSMYVAPHFSSGVGDEGVYFLGLVLQQPETFDTVPPQGGAVSGDYGLDPDVPYLAILGWSPTDRGTHASPCDVVQVRYVDLTGSWQLFGIPLASIRTNDTWRPVDLYASVYETGAEVDEAPEPFSSPECPATDRNPFGLSAAVEAADALDAFLASHDAASIPHSGYQELVDVAADRYYYVRYLEHDPDLIAIVITVEREGAGWIATRWQSTCG